MKNVNIIGIVISCFAFGMISSCAEELAEPMDLLDMTIVATGEVNDEEYLAWNSSFYRDGDRFGFSLSQEKEFCPRIELSFRKIPLELGTFEIKEDFLEGDKTLISNSYWSCGDAVFSGYSIDTLSESSLEIESIDDEIIKGSFTAKYIIMEGFNDPELPQEFFLKDVQFQIKNVQ